MHLVFKVSEGWPVGEPPVVTDGPGVVHKDSLLDDGRTFRLTYQLNDEGVPETASFAIGDGMGSDWREEETLMRGVKPEVYLSQWWDSPLEW